MHRCKWKRNSKRPEAVLAMHRGYQSLLELGSWGQHFLLCCSRALQIGKKLSSNWKVKSSGSRLVCIPPLDDLEKEEFSRIKLLVLFFSSCTEQLEGSLTFDLISQAPTQWATSCTPRAHGQSRQIFASSLSTILFFANHLSMLLQCSLLF